MWQMLWLIIKKHNPEEYNEHIILEDEARKLMSDD